MNDSKWSEFKSAFPLGSIVSGVVTRRCHHGFFVALPLDQQGHVDIINFRKEFRVNDESDFPPEGTGCLALVVGFSEQHKQVGLDTRPFRHPEELGSIEIEVGLRTNQAGELEFFGISAVSACLQRGLKVTSIREGNAFFEKIRETTDVAGLVLTGSSLLITFSDNR